MLSPNESRGAELLFIVKAYLLDGGTSRGMNSLQWVGSDITF
jgi:hypothetical protein